MCMDHVAAFPISTRRLSRIARECDRRDKTMKDILTAPYVAEMIRTATNMYGHGWDERNGGNISLLLSEEETAEYLDVSAVRREIPTGFDVPVLDGKYFLVTGTGKYFKNLQYCPARDLGLIRVADSGRTAQLLWGYSDGGSFTSELPTHLMSHAARLAVNPDNKVVVHCHPTNLLAMTYVHDLDTRAFTRTLWQMCNECILAIPDGVNVLPWMLCGTNEIGAATAEQIKTARLVVWAQHGIYGVGSDLDEAFGLIESAEKAAEIYLKIAHLPLKTTLTDDAMRQLADRFQLTIREGFLD